MHVLSQLAHIFYSQKDIKSVLVLPWFDTSVSVFITNIAYPIKVNICMLWNGKTLQNLKSDLGQFTLGNYEIDQERSLRTFFIRKRTCCDFVVVEYNIPKEELPLLYDAKKLLIIRQGVIYDCTGGTNISSL